MAIVKTLNLSQLAKEFGPKGLLKRQKKVLYEAAYKACLKSILGFNKMTPVDKGLMASANSVSKFNENEIHIGNTAPYAAHVEVGTRPFKPPLKPLVEWAARKLKKPKTSRVVISFAKAVQRKIMKKGITPQRFIKRATEEILMPNIEKAFEEIDPKEFQENGSPA